MYFPIGFMKIFINFRMSTHTHTHTHTHTLTDTHIHIFLSGKKTKRKYIASKSSGWVQISKATGSE